MDLSTYLRQELNKKRAESLANSDQLTLGEMISKLEPIAEQQKFRLQSKRDEATIVYDFEYLYPTQFDSWRGDYAELALNFEGCGHEHNPMTVTEFLKMLKETVGKTFEGYKGGEFEMSENTPVWVANYGNSGNTAVVEIVDAGYKVVLITGYREY